MWEKCREIAVTWVFPALLIVIALRITGARWGEAALVAVGVATGMSIVWAVRDAFQHRRWRREASDLGLPLAASIPPDRPETRTELKTDVWLKGHLGRTPFCLLHLEGEQVLSIGDWYSVIGSETSVRHTQRLLWMTLTVEQPGRAVFTHRYHLPWLLQFAPFWEATYNHTSAEADDPGLVLTEFLDGTSDWHDDPVPPSL